MKAKFLSMFLALCILTSQMAAFAADYEKYYEFSVDFGDYTAEDSQYLSRENELICGTNEDKLIGSKNGFTWMSSAFYSGINGEGGIYIEPENSAIRLRGCNSGYLTTATLNSETKIELAEVTKIHFETDATTRGQGINLFVSSDQKSFYAFGSRNGEFVDYLGTGYEPYVKRVVSNNASVIGTAPYEDNWSNADSHVSWDITVSDNIISWKAVSNTGKTWEGSLADEMDLIKNHEYILAAFGVGDSYGTVKNISFKTGKYYMDGMGEPSPILYKNVIDGKTQNEDNVVSFEDTPSIIRRVYARALKNQKIYLSEDGTGYDEFDLDQNGWWFNDKNEKVYKFIKTEEPTNINRVFVLSPIDDNETVVVEKGQSRMILLFENNANVAVTLPWISSDTRYATITSGGKVTGIKDGSAVISLNRGYKTLKFNIKVSGNLTKAEESGDPEIIAEYIMTQQKIVDVLNEAIKNKDKNRVYEFFYGENSVNFNSLDAISTQILETLTENEKNELSDRIMTYDNGFVFTDIKSIYDFEKTIEREVYTGKLNKLSDITEIKKILTTYNDYFDFPIDSEWLQNTETVLLEKLLDITFANYSDLYNKFSEALILENLNITMSSKYMTDILNAYCDFIKYDTVHFDKVKSTAVTELINSKSQITTVDDIKNFLDKYTQSESKPTSKPSNGGGSSGGSKGSGISTVVNPFVNASDDKSEEKLPAVEKVQLYSDVDIDYWGYEAIRYLNALNAVTGYEDKTFRPENKITRAEFLSILINVFKDNTENSIENEDNNNPNNPFNDVTSDKWYYGVVNSAYNEGLLKGDGGYCFPEQYITRQEIAVFVSRMLNGRNLEINNTLPFTVFEDEDSIADWAVGSVTKLQAAGIINGIENSFMPEKNATRAEAAQIIYKTALSLVE